MPRGPALMHRDAAASSPQPWPAGNPLAPQFCRRIDSASGGSGGEAKCRPTTLSSRIATPRTRRSLLAADGQHRLGKLVRLGRCASSASTPAWRRHRSCGQPLKLLSASRAISFCWRRPRLRGHVGRQGGGLLDRIQECRHGFDRADGRHARLGRRIWGLPLVRESPAAACPQGPVFQRAQIGGSLRISRDSECARPQIHRARGRFRGPPSMVSRKKTCCHKSYVTNDARCRSHGRRRAHCWSWSPPPPGSGRRRSHNATARKPRWCRRSATSQRRQTSVRVSSRMCGS